MKYLAIAVLSLAILAGSHQISRIERDGSWVYMYNESGKKYQTLSANSVGDVLGYSSTFFVSRNGNWIYLYDAEGKRYKTMSSSTVGVPAIHSPPATATGSILGTKTARDSTPVPPDNR